MFDRFTTTESRQLIGQLLRVNPDERLSITDLLNHSWMYIGYEKDGPLDMRSTLPTALDNEVHFRIFEFFVQYVLHIRVNGQCAH